MEGMRQRMISAIAPAPALEITKSAADRTAFISSVNETNRLVTI